MTLMRDADKYTYQLVADKILETLSECLSGDSERKLNTSDWTRAAINSLQRVVANPRSSVASQDEEEIPSLSWPKDWHSTANIRKWYESTCHAAGVLLKAMNSGKLWTFRQFSAELARRYPKYNETVKRLAWRLLPDAFKNGPGRPSSR